MTGHQADGGPGGPPDRDATDRATTGQDAESQDAESQDATGQGADGQDATGQGTEGQAATGQGAEGQAATDRAATAAGRAGGGGSVRDGRGAGWPVAALDDVRRLHVLAGGLRGARVVERHLGVPLPRVWSVMGDLEGAFGEFQTDMRRLRVLSVDGERVTALAVSRFGMRARLRGVLRPGWCWLQSRFLVLGMAAVPDGPDGNGTRIALTGGVRVPGRAALVPGAGRELRRAADRLEAYCLAALRGDGDGDGDGVGDRDGNGDGDGVGSGGRSGGDGAEPGGDDLRRGAAE